MRTRQWGVWLALAVLSTGCASVTPRPGQGMNLRYLPHEAAVTVASPGHGGAGGGARPRHDAEPTRQRAMALHLSFLGAVAEVSASTRHISSELSRLRYSGQGLASTGNGIFVRYLDHAERQRRWIDAELAAATRLATAASQVAEPDMHLALLRLAGPRLEAAMMGSLLLAIWFDFVHLSDDVLSRRHYSVERLYVDLARMEPADHGGLTRGRG